MSIVIDVDTRELSEKGEEIYKRLKDQLEPLYKGKIMAIEINSGDYFIGDTLSEACTKAKQKYPDKIFHFIRIGYPVVYHI